MKQTQQDKSEQFNINTPPSKRKDIYIFLIIMLILSNGYFIYAHSQTTKAEKLRLEEEKIKAELAIESERIAKEEIKRKIKEEAERIVREEAERKASEEAERIAKEEAERIAREEAERIAKKEAERKAREEAERIAKEETKKNAIKKLEDKGYKPPYKLPNLSQALRNNPQDHEIFKLMLTAGIDSAQATEILDDLCWWTDAEKYIDDIKLLIEAGANVNRDLHLPRAVQYNKVSIVKLLLKYGANPNLTDSFWYQTKTALHIAARDGYTTCVELLIAAGADVNITDENKLTPLHLAAYNGEKKAVELLIAAGADVNAEGHFKAKRNATPLDAAIMKGHSRCAKIIREAGGE